MMIRMIEFGNGFQISEDSIINMAEKIARTIMSELPEEIQTYEGATYMLKIVDEKLRAAKLYYKK